MIFGLVIGVIVHFASSTLETTIISFFTPNVFFSFILPPILIEAGYFMPRMAFSVNIVSILTFAVFGTIINCFMLAGSLYGVGLSNLSPALPFLELLMYCAIISAVDPVAVIAVFQELNVNMSLYIVEFGESLLNDGVSLVLYQIFQAMLQNKQLSTQALGWLGLVKFVWIMMIGTLVGLLCGFIGAFLVKSTSTHYTQLQPFLVYGVCFFAYTSCNLLSISSIFGVIACSFFIRPYADHNLTQSNRINLDKSIKLAAHIAEMMVFVLLGVITVNVFFQHNSTFDLNFTLWNLLFVTVIRFIVVFMLGLILNKFSTKPHSIADLVIISYSGLRGGIAFGMIYSLSLPNRMFYVQTTLVIIFFTIFVQGGTIRYLLKWLKIELDDGTSNSLMLITNQATNHVSDGIKGIINTTDSYYNYTKMQRLSKKYLSPLLKNRAMKSNNLLDKLDQLIELDEVR